MTLSADIVQAEIDARLSELEATNKFIHDNPELAYEEHKAHDYLVDMLTKLGFDVTPHAYGVETAFMARIGKGAGRRVCFNAEYDALPDVGHACGHNLIATASLAAFLGLAAAVRKAIDTEGFEGHVVLMGTPAEEGGGGKLRLIEAGAYEGVDACLMVHPGPQRGLPEPIRGVAYAPSLANEKWRVFFTGREAHAALEPWAGVNALDAVCLSYNGISMLRQQMRPVERIHGVFREAGTRPNVTPAHTAVEYYVRSDTRARALQLWERAKKCFEGAALATGCAVRFEPINAYADLRPSRELCRAYVAAMPAGTVAEESPEPAASTDMGNVCYACPGFHGGFGIASEPGQGNHTPGFTQASGTAEAFARAVACGRGMALVGLKVLSDAAFTTRVRKEWEDDMKAAEEV